MRKLLTSILCLVCLLGPGQMSFGQKSPKSISKLTKRIVENPQAGNITRLTQHMSTGQLESVLANLQRENAALERQIARQQVLQQEVFAASKPAVFRTFSPGNASRQSLSGTIFKTRYNGQEEVYGLVPMHVLRGEDLVAGMISYKFTAGVQTPQGIKMIPAWVVQLSSSKTADVALVKFRKEDEALLSPVELSLQEPQFPQQVFSQGFARGILAQQSFQLTGKTSAGILTAQIPAAYQGDRAGLCGSPVVDEHTRLTGIHVGSEYVANAPQEDALLSAFRLNRPSAGEGDIGFVAPASFIQGLVQAYHDPHAKPQEVRLFGREVTRLAVNEYISRIEVLDEQENVVWFKETDYKTSFSALETVLRLLPGAVYVRLYVGRSHWQKKDHQWYVENTDDISSLLYTLPKAALSR